MIEKMPNLTFKKIKSICRIPSFKTRVYNLKCNPYSNFFSNYILLHNCDTTWALVNKRYCKVEKMRGKGFIKIKNPLSVKKVFAIIKKFSEIKWPYHSISLTGGEPLLQKDFLNELLPLIRPLSIKIYLETNGILFKELSAVINYLDIIAMDIKLPSSTGLGDFWDEHKRFLEIVSKKKVFIKIVISNSTELGDLKKAIDLVDSFNKDIPFVLQPNSFEINEKLMIKVRDFQRFCLNTLSDVRIIPQMHNELGFK